MQAVSLTQPEPQDVASKLEILCVFPLRAGGAVSMTQKQHKKRKKQRKLSTKCRKNALFPFSGVNYFSSVLPFLSAVQQGFMGAAVQVLSSQFTVEM